MKRAKDDIVKDFSIIDKTNMFQKDIDDSFATLPNMINFDAFDGIDQHEAAVRDAE